MNFLQLCQRTRSEAGVSRNTDLSPATVVGQSGRLKTIVDWVAEACKVIEREHNWSFRWEEVSLTIPAASNKTTGQAIPAKCYEHEAAHIGSSFLTYVPWEDFRLMFPTIEAGQAGQKPSVWTVDPTMQIRVNITVAADTDITFERYKNPTALALDADTPLVPEEFHMIVVWKAVEYYGQDQEAGVRVATAKENYATLHQQMLARYFPTSLMGEPLA